MVDEGRCSADSTWDDLMEKPNAQIHCGDDHSRIGSACLGAGQGRRQETSRRYREIRAAETASRRESRQGCARQAAGQEVRSVANDARDAAAEVAPLSGERRFGGIDAVATFDHGAFEPACLHRYILGEEPRNGDASGRGAIVATRAAAKASFASKVPPAA